MRDDLVAVTSHASLRVVAASDVAPVGVFRPSHPPHEVPRQVPEAMPVVDHDGRRFVRLDRSAGGGGTRAATVPELLAYLDGSLDIGHARTAMDSVFIGTPVRDLWGVASVSGTIENPRGIALDSAKAGLVERDGHAEATAALQAFLDETILVVGEEVYRRFRPSALIHRLGRNKFEVSIKLNANAVCGGPVPYAPTRIEEALRSEGLPTTAPLSGGGLVDLALADADTDPSHDVDRHMRFYAGMTARWLKSLERQLRAAGADLGEHRRLAAEFVPLHMQARIGGLAREDYPEAARAIYQAVDHVFFSPHRPDSIANHLAEAKEYMLEIAMPRYAALTRPGPEDEDAIGMLAP